MASNAADCSTHPGARASYVCTRCNHWQCERCAKPMSAVPTGPRSCGKCDGIVRVARVVPAYDTWEQALYRIMSRDAAIVIVALALPGALMAIGSLLGLFLFVIYVGVLATYYFQTVTHVASFQEGIPFSSSADDIYSIGKGFARALAPVTLAIGPAFAASLLAPDSTWLVVAALIVGCSLMPASLVAGVVSGNMINQLWPLAWFEVIARNIRGYAKLLLWLYASLMGWAAAILFLSWLLDGSWVRWLLLPPVHNFCAIGQAVMFGRFLQQHGSDYGFGTVRTP